jgi:hypothetical protein
MTVYPNPRLPARADDDLLLDRPARQEWHDARQAVSYEDRVDDRPARAPLAPRAASAGDVVSRGIGTLIKLTVLLILLAVLWGLVAMVNAGIRAPTAIGEQIGNAVERGASAIGAVGQRVADTFDPSHPPRQTLAQDVEIDELLRLNVGEPVAGSSTRDLTIASIQRRADPAGPDGAVYAVLHGELKQAQETKVLGVTVRSTRDPQDSYLYKGETIRIGRKLYKVNWVSIERQQVALIAYREQDRVTAPLKAEID